MKSKKLGYVVLVLLLSVVVGCNVNMSTSREQMLRDSGFPLFGERPLTRIESFGAIEGSISGSFFLGIGSINGSLGNEFKLQFYWSPKPNEIVVTALPYSKFRFVIDETKNTPTVEFIFERWWLDHYPFRKAHYSEELYPNINDFVLLDAMAVVKVRITSAMMEKEVYLPKTR